MRNIKLIIEYDGTDYAGWQIQNSSPFAFAQGKQPIAHSSRKKSIQETIEETLRKILQEKVKITGSGRTDAGVHALAQTANFKTNSALGLGKIQKALNSLLPSGISINKIQEAESGFHSRYQAKSKTYRYYILNSQIRSAFLNKYAWHIPYELDVRLMQKESKTLIGKHDFKSFCASGSSAKTKVRTIKNISIATIRYPLYAIRYPLIAIDIEADGFLYNMVRNIVGTLVEIGRKRFPATSMESILQAQDRKKAGPTAPAQGLFLLKVKY